MIKLEVPLYSFLQILIYLYKKKKKRKTEHCVIFLRMVILFFLIIKEHLNKERKGKTWLLQLLINLFYIWQQIMIHYSLNIFSLTR